MASDRGITEPVGSFLRDWDVVTLKFECLYNLYIMEWGLVRHGNLNTCFQFLNNTSRRPARCA